MAGVMANTPNNKSKLTKRDAETIAEGEQISGDLSKDQCQRLRSSSRKTYYAGISIQPDSAKMGSIEKVLENGGVDHANAESEIQVSDIASEQDQNKTEMEKGISQLISMVFKIFKIFKIL